MNKGLSAWRKTPTGPVMAALFDRLGRRWALRVVWELRDGPRNFRALQTACGRLSPSVLQVRLHELGEAGIVEKVPRLGYRLSIEGEGLCAVLGSLYAWRQTAQLGNKKL